ncbi:MAG: gliding motility-associated C-terminal domain-containing protein, partial [Chitinophagales bacterium]|nr:gliding motility-associated C-terminal domain-containing protein [Chitinophagales bacterium]
GTYYIRRRATDKCGNTNVSNVINFIIPQRPAGTISPASQSVCPGSQAVFTLNFTVGTPPFNIQLTDGVNFYQRFGKNSGDTVRLPIFVSPTTFSIDIIEDNNGCLNFNVNSSAFATISPAINISGVSVTNVSCFGGSNGSITISASGGTPPFQYSINNGLNYQTSNTFNGLTAGNYFLVVRDALGCTQTYSANPVVITQPTQVVASSVSQDASCSGVFDGQITVSASGGTPPYTYSLNGGPSFTNPVISGLGAGIYTIIVTDAQNCTVSIPDTINNSYVVTSSVGSKSDVSCFGGNDGQFTISVSGGIPPYQYSINGGLTYQSLPNFTNLTAGNYLVKIIDSKGCPVIQSVTITQPSKLQLSLDSVINPGCFGGNSGSVFVKTSGGTPSYTYVWSSGATTEDLINVPAGSYRVTVTDNNSCKDSLSVTISQPGKLFVSLASSTNVSCNGGNDGTIDITVGGGTLPYSFLWSNGHTGEDLVGIPGNTYTVTVTDANGCTETLTRTITEPLPLSLSLTSNTIICNGAKNGNINSQVSGGTSPYRYLWSTGDTTANLSGVGAGSYTLIVTDANNCTITGTVILTEPPVYTVNLTVTHVLCFGDSSGSISANAGGGTPPYSFAWSNGGNTQAINNIPAGFYTVTVTDFNGCSSTASTVVNEPTALVVNSSVFDVTCAGLSNGIIDLSVGGGVFPYTYQWSNSATSQDLTNISGGSYSVTVKDNNNCQVVRNFTVNEPNPINITFSKSDLLCFGTKTGSATATVTGGTPPYNYFWSNFSGSNSINNVGGGTYILFVTDAQGCQKRDSVIINEPAPLVLSANILQITCFNANNGVIDLSVNGGTPGYSYLWSNSATTQDLTNLSQGTYIVTVTDANQCTSTAQYSIINPPLIITNKFITTPTCAGDSNGKIDLVVSGGVPPYAYAWNNGANTEDISNLPTGTYIVTITDSRSCTAVDTAKVGEPQPLFTTGFIKDVTCKGYADGFLDITAYGGTLPYYFLWSKDSIITEDIGALSGGTYYVTVTDGNGCTVSGTYFVYEPDSLKLTFNSTNITCYGGSNGAITPIVTGGNYPYTFTWSNFSGDSVQSNLSAGSYILLVQDFKGCIARDSVKLTQPQPFDIDASIVNVSCSGKQDGSIKITVSGSNGNYSYSWSNGVNLDSIGNLSAGTYILTVTDGLGCTAIQSFDVVESKKLVADVAVVNPSCNGATTGFITVDVTGGDPPYFYNWSTQQPQNNNTASNLGAGTYTVTITDSKGCTITETRTITTPNPLNVSVNTTGSRCANIGSGTVKAIIQGGTAPFIYILNGQAQSSDSFSGLLPGNYVLLVRDANGCEGITAFTIPVPTPLVVDLTSDKEVILSGMEVQLEAIVTSDTTITRYIWQPLGRFTYPACNDTLNCPNPRVTPLITTTFAVSVENAYGCIASDTLQITVLNQQSFFIPTAFTPNNDGLNDRFEFDILGVTEAHVKIFDRWGNLIYENLKQKNGLGGNDGWDGTFKGKPVQLDTYVYQITATYFDGSEKKFTGTIAVMR